MTYALPAEKDSFSDYIPDIRGWIPAKDQQKGDPLTEYDPFPPQEIRLGSNPRYPIWEFKTSESAEDQVSVVSRIPLAVTIVRGEELFFAENERLHIFASGDFIEDAIRDLIDQVVDQYLFYLRPSSDLLTKDAQDIKALFEEYFYEVESA